MKESKIMKTMFRLMVVAALCVISFVGISSISFAEDAVVEKKSSTSIAVVDVRALLSDSKAAKSIEGQIQKKRDGFLKNLAKEEKELRDLEKELIDSKDKSSPEEFAKKRKSFEEKLLATRKEAEEERRDLEKIAAKASDQLRDEITKVVEGIVKEKGYDLVLSSQNVVVGNNTLNITKEVMDRLNKDVSSISVK